MSTARKLNLNDLAATIVACFPKLDDLEQRLSLELYRLLAGGRPVPRESLAERLQIPVETVSQILDKRPGVFSDAPGRVVGYWGLSLPTAYASPHRLTIDGQALSAWCAWDTLFLPQLLGRIAQIESTTQTGAKVSLTVSPQRLESVDPITAQMSLLVPGCEGLQKDVITSFCHFVQFFPSHQAAQNWTPQHAGTFLLSVHEAHILARLKNEAQYRDVLSYK